MPATTEGVLLGLVAIVAVGGLLASLAARWRQPAVLGEILAGVALGPTLLGQLPGDPARWLFPTEVRPVLSVLAEIGVVLFMFAIGYELDLSGTRENRLATAAVSISSVVLPFALGAGLAALIYPWHDPGGDDSVHRLAFILFLGVAMSITAFPVLARIIDACNLSGSRFGAFVMTCAAATDVISWGLLALVTALVAGSGALGGAGLRVCLLVLFVAILAVAVRPLLSRLLYAMAARRASTHAVFAVVTAGLFLCAWITSRLGFHPIFGAFLFGVILPRAAMRAAGPAVPGLVDRSALLLMPAFFIVAGMNVNLLDLDARALAELPLILLVACCGKFLGVYAAARACGMDQRYSAGVGVLMNSRGLTELVVVQVGVSLGILDTRMTMMMIAMALVTTFATPPLFRRLRLTGADFVVRSDVDVSTPDALERIPVRGR